VIKKEVVVDSFLKENQNWANVKLGELISFEYGKSLVKSERNHNSHYPVFGSSGLIGYHSDYLVKGPSLIIGRKGSIGKVYLVKSNCWPIDTTYFIKPTKHINLYFLNQLLVFLNLGNLDKSTAVPGLNRNDAYNIEIPLPPLNEQKRIVAKIEELFTNLDAGVESLKRLKAQVKKYRQSVLKSAFEGNLTKEWREEQMKDLALTKKSTNTKFEENHSLSNINKSSDNSSEVILFKVPDNWKWTSIGNNATFIGSGVTPKGGKKVYVSEGILFIRSQNVYMSGLKTDDIACITKEIHEKMKRTKIQSKDVLLNITGASIGRSTTIPINIKEANVNQHVCIIRNPYISPYFLSYFLNSKSGQVQIFQMQSGATREGLNFQQVRALKIPLPPISEQHQIVSEIERHFSIADAVEKIIDESLNKAEKLRQSILKKAFEGKLVPQDPNDEPASVLLEKIKAEKAEREAEAGDNAVKKKALPRKKKTEVK
jgi:type I restriction enzyme S subunit